jgi:hypothetical protein
MTKLKISFRNSAIAPYTSVDSLSGRSEFYLPCPSVAYVQKSRSVLSAEWHSDARRPTILNIFCGFPETFQNMSGCYKKIGHYSFLMHNF